MSRPPTRDPALGPGQSGELLALGNALVRSLALLLRTGQIHDRRNEALRKPLHDVQEVLAQLHRLDSTWEIRVRNDYLHLCDVRLKVDLDIFGAYHFLLDELKRRRVGTLAIRWGIGKRELLDLLYVFLEAGREEEGADAYEALADRLAAAGLDGVLIEPLEEGELPWEVDAAQSVRRRSVMTFVRALYLSRDVLTAADSRRVVNIRRVKKLVATLVDVMNVDESVLLGLTNIKNFDDYTFNHSVNVCILSIAVGRRLGLPRRQLGELGLAAVFHDLGKVSIPREVIAKAERLGEQDWLQIERHPVEGVRKLVQIKGLNEVTTKLIVSVFRHHNNLDASGYPPMRPGEELPFFSKIIRIADSYDAMTSARSYRRRTLCGVEAVEELWSLSGSVFEPALLKVFVATVGLFPVGSVVQLSSGEVAVVSRNHLDVEDLSRPVVRPVARWDGVSAADAEVDLRRTPEVVITGYYPGTSVASSILDLML